MRKRNNLKILFFIGTLSKGGKERRLIELLTYLKANTNYELFLVLRQNIIEYPAFFDLEIPYTLLTEKYTKGDLTLHFKFYKICRKMKPDIIHTWGSMPAFVSILSVVILNITHVNSQITDAPLKINKVSIRNIKNRINFYFSDIILANSYAGIESYTPPKSKSKVIYNGLNIKRFKSLRDVESVKAEYGINTDFVIVMVASFSAHKDYDKFYEVSKIVMRKRNDVTFVAVGDGQNFKSIKEKVILEKVKYFILTGRISRVEELINMADIGILFTNKQVHGEGISNSIAEYMALGKPVIVNDAGGTREIVRNGENGFLITDESNEEIATMIINLIDDDVKRQSMGNINKERITSKFSIELMGMEFIKVYNELAINHSN